MTFFREKPGGNQKKIESHSEQFPSYIYNYLHYTIAIHIYLLNIPLRKSHLCTTIGGTTQSHSVQSLSCICKYLQQCMAMHIYLLNIPLKK